MIVAFLENHQLCEPLLLDKIRAGSFFI